jgi:hypothetical protein
LTAAATTLSTKPVIIPTPAVAIAVLLALVTSAMVLARSTTAVSVRTPIVGKLGHAWSACDDPAGSEATVHDRSSWPSGPALPLNSSTTTFEAPTSPTFFTVTVTAAAPCRERLLGPDENDHPAGWRRFRHLRAAADAIRPFA